MNKIWEWCGFKDVHYNSLGAIGQKWSGRLPSKDWVYLELTLDNLFKWPVAKLRNTLSHREYRNLMLDWIDEITAVSIKSLPSEPDPVQTLTKAIERIIDNG